jgi:hypothetical protein
MPPMAKLFKLTDSVQEYAQHVLPIEQAGRRPRASLRLRSSSGSLVSVSRTTSTTNRESTQASSNQEAIPDGPSVFPEIREEDSRGQMPLEEDSPVRCLNYCTESSGSCTQVEAHKPSIMVPVSDTSSGSQPSREATPPPMYQQEGAYVSEIVMPKTSSRSMTTVLPTISHKREFHSISPTSGPTAKEETPKEDEVKLDNEICEQKEEESKDEGHTNDDLRQKEYPAAILSRPIPIVRGQFPPTWRKRRERS